MAEGSPKQKTKETIGKHLKNVKKRNNPFMVIIVLLVAWAIMSFVLSPTQFIKKDEVSLSQVFSTIKSGEVDAVTIDGDTLELSLKNGKKVESRKESTVSFYELLLQQQIDPNMVSGGVFEKKGFDWLMIVSNFAVPVVMIVFLWWIFSRSGQSAGGLFSLGKSRAKLFLKDDKNSIGFADVAGAKEIKGELTEVVDFLKNPEKYQKLGARIPKGILLIGPAGVGKTLLARAIAGEANVPFYSVAGSEFIEMIVGVGSARVRDLFAQAKLTAPSLIFIDEVDAIGRHRGRNAAMSNDEREQTLNQILVEMDGFDPRTNVIIIAATNRPDMLDPALVRPGRFDRHIRLNLPNAEEREEILKIHMKGKPFSVNTDMKKLARQSVGFSGADLENMLNEAAILAARREGKEIEQRDLVEASTKVKLGPERRLLQTEKEREMVAYHEAGHALVAAVNPDADPVSRISIISRTMSLGHTEFSADDKIYNQTKKKLLAHIQTALGGRVAEELVFEEETVGAANDIEQATRIARHMITDFGMSSLGPIQYISDNAAFWDVEAQDKSIGYSQDIARKIDEEVHAIITAEYENAKKCLREHRKTLDVIARELLEKETLEQDDFDLLITPKKPKTSTEKSL